MDNAQLVNDSNRTLVFRSALKTLRRQISFVESCRAFMRKPSSVAFHWRQTASVFWRV